MRLSFPNLTRPKKSAKIVARLLGLPLSTVQAAISRICGYQDWHDFELNHAENSSFALDQHLSQPEYVARQTQLILSLAAEASVADGDAQFALAHSRLTGDRPVSLADQIALRLSCWRQTVLPPVAKRARGAVGVLKSPGRNGECIIGMMPVRRGIWLKSGRRWKPCLQDLACSVCQFGPTSSQSRFRTTRYTASPTLLNRL
jgi:hypothetical protein